VSVELVAAVCHEIGNLLAGARLLAAEGESDPGGRIARSLGRAGALVALLPSLLPAWPPRGAGAATEPLEVLSGLWRGIDAADETRLRIELRSAVDLPSVALDAETLHHLLLAQLLAALDDGAREVSVAASAAPGAVRFRIRGLAPDPATGSLLRGVAEAILGPLGGRIERFDAPPAPGVELWVPRAGGKP
jgi:hypothetical protein